MSLGPYTIFHKAADQLVTDFKMRRSGKVSPGQPIPPVMVILFAILENFGAISSPFSHHEPFPAVVLSNLEDKAGSIPECAYRQYTIKAPSALTQVQISPGDLLMIHVMLTIKPLGIQNNQEWLIEYHPGNGPYFLGFKEVVFLEKM